MKPSFLAFHFKQSATFPLRVFVAFFCAEMFNIGHVMFHVKNKKRTNPDLALSHSFHPWPGPVFYFAPERGL